MRTLTSVEPLLPVLTDVAISLPLVCRDMLLTGPGPFRLERSQLPYFTIATVHDLFSTDLSAYLVGSSDHSILNHRSAISPRSVLLRYITVAALCAYPNGQILRSMGSPSRKLGFTIRLLAPRQAWPNQVHFRYGLVVRLRLLSTLCRHNAVTTVDYGLVTLAREGLAPS